jgi:hypothetical protein
MRALSAADLEMAPGPIDGEGDRCSGGDSDADARLPRLQAEDLRSVVPAGVGALEH